MGFGLPAAMGAQAALPDALVVDIDGDGSFLMNIQELATVYCENLPVKVIVLNNQHLGHGRAVGRPVPRRQPCPHLPRPRRPPRGHRPRRGRPPRGHLPRLRRRSPRASASPARQIRHKYEVIDALKEMIAHPGPYVLDVLVPYQEHVLPMIPAGGRSGISSRASREGPPHDRSDLS